MKIFDLYKLEKFIGCILCFGCKLPEHKGVCIYKDGLTLVLEEIRQVNDYSKYNWTMFNPDAKKKCHEEVFPSEMKKAFSLGAEIVKKY